MSQEDKRRSAVGTVTVKGLLVEIRDILKARMPLPVAKESPAPISMPSGSYLVALSSPSRFTKLPDGWIKDSILGVEWGPSSEKRFNFKDAQEYCAKLNARLPSRMELITLQNITKHEPATFPIFTDTKTDDYYWSGDTCAWDSGYAWVVGFDYGYVGSFSKGSSNYVRPVRSSQ